MAEPQDDGLIASRRPRCLGYVIVLVVPALSVLSVVMGGWWSFCGPIVLFGLVPFVELALPLSTANLSLPGEANARSNLSFRLLLWLCVPIQCAVVGLFLWRVATSVDPWHVYVGMLLSVGICCGVLGINVAHELGHRSSRLDRGLARVLLGTTLYVHFIIEHNRGHHRRVGTRADPATARRGEMLPVFITRSLVLGWLSAWRLEAERLSRLGCRWLSLHNEMLWMQTAQVVVAVMVGGTLGPRALVAWFSVASLGVVLLETVNYVEHYGLTRRPLPDGGIEAVDQRHSWCSNHALGRLFLLELTRHADHHANVGRPYQVLRHLPGSPQLPLGYPMMVLVAWVPPLWFRVMDPRVDLAAACEMAPDLT